MVQALVKPISFDEFIDWYPEEGRIGLFRPCCRNWI
jgi:hypothetical protein